MPLSCDGRLVAGQLPGRCSVLVSLPEKQVMALLLPERQEQKQGQPTVVILVCTHSGIKVKTCVCSTASRASAALSLGTAAQMGELTRENAHTSPTGLGLT